MDLKTKNESLSSSSEVMGRFQEFLLYYKFMQEIRAYCAEARAVIREMLALLQQFALQVSLVGIAFFIRRFVSLTP